MVCNAPSETAASVGCLRPPSPCGAWQADALPGARDEDPETGLPALRWVRKDKLDVRALSSGVKKVYTLAQAAGASAG